MSIAIGNSPISDVKIGTTSVSAVYFGTTQVWGGTPVPSYTGFYVEDVSGSANIISLVKNNASAPTLTIETSSDGQTWSTLGQTDTTALDISVPANGKTYVRCNAASWGQRISNTTYYNYFNTATGNFKVGGNSMSLLYGSSFTGNETTFPTGSTDTFFRMFSSNGYLTNASDLLLPSATLTPRCYNNMFRSCSNLTAAPTALPATTLADSCCNGMFYQCTSLSTIPSTLPATTLATGCYGSMFRQTAIQTSPSLPATTLVDSCYGYMFQGCTNLTQAPELPATTLAQQCYQDMFNGCTSLSNVTCLATNISATDCTTRWLNNVAATGTFTKAASMSGWTTGASGIPTGWTTIDYIDYSEPFYVEDVSGSANTISLVKNNASAPTLTIETSSDGQNWSTLGQTSTTALDIQIPANGKVYVRCNTDSWGGNYYNYFSTATGNFKVGGNIMSLLYGSNFTGNETSFPSGSQDNFRSLFSGNTYLVDITSLILPATTLTKYCYFEMFSRCTSLTTAPTLPATTLAENCYNSMFVGCTSLTAAPELPATTLAQYCYNTMFQNCTSLIQAPVLPATTLAKYCYRYMFRNCTSLSNVTCLATNISASNCTYHWLEGVAASGIFVKSDNMSSWTRGISGIPANWQVVNDPSTYDYTEPFYFEDRSGNANTIEFIEFGLSGGGYAASDVYVSNDKTTWSQAGTLGDHFQITVPANGRTYVKMESPIYSDGQGGIGPSSADDDFAVGGNINSLIYGNSFTGNERNDTYDNYAFYLFFGGNALLVDASKLLIPLEEVGQGSFASMFNGCSRLQYAPEWLLPATLDQESYMEMFSGCSSLSTSPVLPATTVPGYAYLSMFNGCTSLANVTCLAEDITATDCTETWVMNVAANGKFYKARTMSSWTTGNNGIPSGWTTVSV